ncbi:MauE/DoxX family redox-associated membrane protein [Streptomyces sp. MS06]|uniref:MauE/DoxX family redox-associated membrane protein n=1 Tax=Streptomyces sp. MS06 TaxID=3385974 RepID=UPI0039A149F5
MLNRSLKWFTGVLYAAMGIGQLASFSQMPHILSAYGLKTDETATVLPAALIAGELACGIWFLVRPRSRSGLVAWVYTGVSAVWTLLSVQAYLRGLAVSNSGTFGVYFSQRLNWFALLQNVAASSYSYTLFHVARRARTQQPVTGADGVRDVHAP